MRLNHLNSSYGWRKCSNNQARRTETERSGNPLWGLQALCWIIPNCWRAFCCLSWLSTNLSLEPSGFPPRLSSSPKLLLAAWIWPIIASLRHRNCLEIVCSAKAVYGFAEPMPVDCSNQDITNCIWVWYCLYLCSTCKFHTPKSKVEQQLHFYMQLPNWKIKIFVNQFQTVCLVFLLEETRERIILVLFYWPSIQQKIQLELWHHTLSFKRHSWKDLMLLKRIYCI